MSIEPGDYIKVEFKDAAKDAGEWMWVKVDHIDEENRLVFGTLDNEPVANADLRLGMEMAVSFDNIREHVKPSAFGQ